MTQGEKEEIVKLVALELKEEFSIYVGNSVIRSISKILGVGVVALITYLVSHGFIKI